MQQEKREFEIVASGNFVDDSVRALYDGGWRADDGEEALEAEYGPRADWWAVVSGLREIGIGHGRRVDMAAEEIDFAVIVEEDGRTPEAWLIGEWDSLRKAKEAAVEMLRKARGPARVAVREISGRDFVDSPDGPILQRLEGRILWERDTHEEASE